MNIFETIPLRSNSLNFRVKHVNPYNQDVTLELLNKCWQVKADDGLSDVVERVFVNIFLDIPNPESGIRETTELLSGRPAGNMVMINSITSLIKGKYYLYNPDLTISNPAWQTFGVSTKLIYVTSEVDPNENPEFRLEFLEYANS